MTTANSNGSIQAWREARLSEYALERGGVLKYKPGDVLALAADENGVNPLLAIVADHTNPNASPQQVEETLSKITPEQLEGIIKALNKVMCALVVWPPLIEQGHEEGVSLTEFTLSEKMDFFMDLAGGEANLSAASGFHEVPPGGLVAIPEQQHIREQAVNPVESDV